MGIIPYKKENPSGAAKTYYMVADLIGEVNYQKNLSQDESQIIELEKLALILEKNMTKLQKNYEQWKKTTIETTEKNKELGADKLTNSCESAVN